MLSAEALRLAAFEALCPYASVLSDTGWPTLARHRVYDSRPVAVEDLDRSADYTPVLSLWTPKSTTTARGAASDAYDYDASAMLDIQGELAVVDRDDGVEFADAMARTDPEARLVLAALMAHARFILCHSQKGAIFRTICKQVVSVEEETFAVPQLGLRYHRINMRLHCDIGDDDFDVPPGHLPEPINTLLGRLPDGSYSKVKLAALAAYFAPDVLQPLASVHVTTGSVTSGPTF